MSRLLIRETLKNRATTNGAPRYCNGSQLAAVAKLRLLRASLGDEHIDCHCQQRKRLTHLNVTAQVPVGSWPPNAYDPDPLAS